MPDIEPIPDGIDDDEVSRLLGLGERYRNQEARRHGMPLPGPNTPVIDHSQSSDAQQFFNSEERKANDPLLSNYGYDQNISHTPEHSHYGNRDVEWFHPKNYMVPYLTGEPNGEHGPMKPRVTPIPDPTPKRHIAVVKPKEIDEVTTHKLKTWTEYFEPLMMEEKSCEIRLNDRDFRVGDCLVLEDFNPVSQEYTGRSEIRIVSHIISNQQWLQPGYVAMSVRKPR